MTVAAPRNLLIPFLLLAGALPAAEPVVFGRDVLPLLSDNCLSCHGPDEAHRKADLRLDTREGALVVLKPGQPEASELFARLVTDDPDELMPPPKSHKPRLKPEQIDTLRRWIAEGAPWGRHWAFEAPIQLPVAEHPVDHWVRTRLRETGHDLAPPAPASTLLRRLSFDLTGLPPDPALADRSYEAAVDALLASPHFGERLAMWWLDAARYADTDGFQSDATRTNWPWRDWVVNAFNANLPFDRFTLEQFAGDLLPNATPEQVLATCFHRNHMTNGEGGRDPEESRIDYVNDRVNTVGTVWLGLTLGCAQCHTHKFDPIPHRDYYRLGAFFNSIDEDGKAGAGAKPFLAYTSPAGSRAVAEARLLAGQRRPAEAAAKAAAEPAFATWLAQQRAKPATPAWIRLEALEAGSAKGSLLQRQDDGSLLASGPNPRQDDYLVAVRPALTRVTGLKLEVLPSPQAAGERLARGRSGEFILTDIKARVRRRGSSQVRDLSFAGAVADAEKAQKAAAREYGSIQGVLDDDPRNGWTTEGHDPTQPRTAVLALAEPLVLGPDEELVLELQHRSTTGDANLGRFRWQATDQAGPTVRTVGSAPLEELAALQLEDETPVPEPLRARLFEQFLADHAPYQEARAARERADRQLAEAEKAAGKLNVMVLKQRAEVRPTHVLLRGVWDKKGEVVTPGVPEAVAPWPADLPADRLGLARWLTSPDNPLTARVVVNQLWQLLFGAGLVRTPDDFGLQGERPTHPELLDWLAVEFRDSGWDVKRLLRLIVTSQTYRQDSAHRPGLDDPDNRLLGRGARFRLPAWMIRDGALAAAGLLNPAVGGPPVRPYQPEGVWEEIFMGRFTYEPSEGAAQFRRTLYAFWRRSSAPTFLFDSAQRRVCEVAVARTNTPLQALTLLNDGTIREAAQVLATQAQAAAKDSAGRIDFLARRILSRPLDATERAVLERELVRARQHYQAHPRDAEQLLRHGQSPLPAQPELAALCLAAGLLFNLDEAITHE